MIVNITLYTGPLIPALHCAPFFTGKETVVNGEGINAENGGVSAETNAAMPTSDHPVFPVMVYSHGLGAMSLTYSGICADVASHGYVVASVEHR